MRLRNLSPVADSFGLQVITGTWQTTFWNVGFTQEITQLVNVGAGTTADFGVKVKVPASARPGEENIATIAALSKSATPYRDTALLFTQAEMTYTVRDSDNCGTGVQYNWIDATGGTRWDLNDTDPLFPEWVRVDLPTPFVFYNVTYDHLWVNDHGSVLFGDDNKYDDDNPSTAANPPIPSDDITDPNGAIHAMWGPTFLHAGQSAESAVYTLHDTSNGQNLFVIEYHEYEIAGGDAETFEVVLDLNSYEIRSQYHTITYDRWAVVGIENQFGTEGILYVDERVPEENRIHDGLAVHYGLGDPTPITTVGWVTPVSTATGNPNGVVTHTLTLSNTGTLPDVYDLSVFQAQFPITIMDATFTNPINETPVIAPCEAVTIGVRVDLPADTDFVEDVALIQARSQSEPLVNDMAEVTTNNARAGVNAGISTPQSGIPGNAVTHTLQITNTGNVTDSYQLTLTGGDWEAGFAGSITQTQSMPINTPLTVQVVVTVPVNAPINAGNLLTFTATSLRDGLVADSTLISTTAELLAAVTLPAVQTAEAPPNRVFVHQVLLKNAGNITDTYDLSLAGFSWTTTLTQTATSVTLAPQATRLVRVAVVVPAGSPAGISDSGTLTAQSQNYAVSAQTQLTTEVAETPAISIIPNQTSGNMPGLSVDYTVVFTNAGNIPDDYEISLTNFNWFTQFLPPHGGTTTTVFDLDPNDNGIVRVRVTISAAAPMGAIDHVVVTVRSLTNGSVVATTTLTTVVGANPNLNQRLYLPLIRR
jgi:uncharacterized membrane protein